LAHRDYLLIALTTDSAVKAMLPWQLVEMCCSMQQRTDATAFAAAAVDLTVLSP